MLDNNGYASERRPLVTEAPARCLSNSTRCVVVAAVGVAALCLCLFAVSPVDFTSFAAVVGVAPNSVFVGKQGASARLTVPRAGSSQAFQNVRAQAGQVAGAVRTNTVERSAPLVSEQKDLQSEAPVFGQAEPTSLFATLALPFVLIAAGAAGFAGWLLVRPAQKQAPRYAMMSMEGGPMATDQTGERWSGMSKSFDPSAPKVDAVSVRDRDASGSPLYRPGEQPRDLAEIWDSSTPVIVQGGSLRTWSFANPSVESVQVLLKTEGRPLDADVELWQGPDNTPHKMRVYVEDGAVRIFNAVIGTPRGPNTIAIRNIGQLEFPVDAVVRPDRAQLPTVATRMETIQGGALQTYPFDPTVESVAILLKTDGRPLNARIELLQGPNNNKQVVELYTEDGMDRPFFAIVETPGSGNVVRCVNTAPVEFPLYASVMAYRVGNGEQWPDDGLQVGRAF